MEEACLSISGMLRRVVVTLLLLFPAGAAFLSSSRQQQTSLRNIQNIPHHIESLLSLHETLPKKTHWVDGIECVEVVIDVPLVGSVTVLEATAESQEDLVNLALEENTTITATLNAGDPYGAVLWPAASAIASHLMTNITSNRERPLEGFTLLELGTGTGLISIAASLGGAKSILATDYESVPLRLLEYAAQHLNPRATTPIQTGACPSLHLFRKLQRVMFVICECISQKHHYILLSLSHAAHLDLCESTTPLPFADLVVAADIMYEPNTGRAMAQRAVQALRQGSRVLVGDSPGRAGRPAFLDELNELGIQNAKFVQVAGWTCCGPRHELICGKGSRSISETPQELPVDILDLDPATCFR